MFRRHHHARVSNRLLHYQGHEAVGTCPESSLAGGLHGLLLMSAYMGILSTGAEYYDVVNRESSLVVSAAGLER